MNKQFSDNAWQDLMDWQREDRKIVKKSLSYYATLNAMVMREKANRNHCAMNCPVGGAAASRKKIV